MNNSGKRENKDMNSNSLALIDIEAEGRRRDVVTEDAAAKVMEMLAVAPRVAPAELAPGLRASVELVLGSGAVVSEEEVAVLRKAALSLPPCVEPESFAWAAVDGPGDIDPLVRAVMVYHRFNVQAVTISEKIGANDDFRRFVRLYSGDGEAELASVVGLERRHADRIAGFLESVTSFVEKAGRVFTGGEWSIGAVLVLTAAVGGFQHSRDIIASGWTLPCEPAEECLDLVESLRMELAYSARQVMSSHGLNLLAYSLPALAGIRRSLEEGGGGFAPALSVFGIEEHDGDRLVALASDISAFLRTCEQLEEVLRDNRFSPADMPAITSQVLVRKYLKEAAAATGIEWSSVSHLLSARDRVSPEDLAALVEAIEADTFSPKLDSISRDRRQPIGNVVYAADHYVYSRLYWIDAGERVTACDPGIRMMDLKAILELEPEIRANTEVLARAGVVDRRDVEVLERHLEWLIAVYAMPIPDGAVRRIVESRGEALEGLLTEP